MIADNWLAHRTQRYHTNPHLARIGQTLADHAHGVASLIGLLHPSPSADLLLAALWHDVGEAVVGDLPSPYRRLHPQVAALHARTEELAAKALRRPTTLADDDEAWLRLADGAEAIIFCAHHKPELLSRPDWAAHLQDTIARAERLCCKTRLLEAMRAILDAHGVEVDQCA
jgi:5'-deoxynucleotidase